MRNLKHGILRTLLPLLLLLGAALAPATAATHRMKSNEMRLFRLISADSGQMRPSLKLDPILCRVARNRAADMAARDYFSHVTTEGRGANTLVTRIGYELPGHYSKAKDANNIESIAQAAFSPAQVLAFWKNSSAHRSHLLAKNSFFLDQTRIGIGIVRKPGTTMDVFVFLSAPPNLNPHPPYWVLKNHLGKVIATTGSP